MFFLRLSLSFLLCFLAVAGHVKALDCAADAGKQTCQLDTDCHDAANLQGLDQSCGTLVCISGTCEFVAWVDTGSCASTNFRTCSGVDDLCTKGPGQLNFSGTCTGWENNECVYRWCPGDEAGPTTPGCTPCAQASDCHDPDNLIGLDESCGNLACVMGKCEYVAWNEAENCASTNFLVCDGDDTKCTKGPNNVPFQGTCTGFNNNECIYTWCPGDTDTSANAPPETPAPTPLTKSPTIPPPPPTTSPSAIVTPSPTEAPTAAPSRAPSSLRPCNFGPGTTLPLTTLPDDLTMRQFVNSNDGTVTMEVIYEGKGWIGIGYSPGGLMLGSKAVIGLPDKGTVDLYELKWRDPSGIIPVPGSSAIITNASIVQTNTQTIMRFTRPATQDGQVVFQAGQASTLIYAVGSSNTLGYHPGRSSSSVVFEECQRY